MKIQTELIPEIEDMRVLKLKKLIKNLGVRSAAAAMIVFLLTVAATCVGGYLLYNATKESVYLKGRVNAVQSAKDFDGYLLVRKNTVILASHVVDEMIRDGRPHSKILEYLTAESLSIKKSIDKDYTGLYGWINGEYCDGDGWVPDEDYVPTERPWYLETMADDRDVTFVSPYVDEQTHTVLTTMAKQLSDGKSVIAMDVTLSRIQDITEKVAADTPGSIGIVLDSTGQVIAHSDAGELGKNYLEEKNTLGSELAPKLFEGSQAQFDFSYENQKYMVFVERIEGGWLSVSLINTRIFYRPLIFILILLALLTVLEAVVFASVLYNQMRKNLALASAEEAMSANRAKSRFLSRMSHEIRTPINAIIGLDSIALRDEGISAHTREELEKIGSSAKHLLSIINDILDMSRIESGRVVLKEELFSFQEFLDQINVIVSGQCAEKGLRYTCEKMTAVDEYFIGDNLKLRQVLINILGNSVKFTDPPGEITFLIEQTETDGNQPQLLFTMKDTGVGMDEEYLPKLFDAFSQEDTGNTTRYGGSGLGLAITKSFVDLMNGDIRVESKKGVGTTFYVTVPLRVADEADLPKTASKEAGEETSSRASLAGCHILIAEDQEMNAEVLTDLLELEGLTSEWAENGRKAVELFEKSKAGHFDAILMDMRMPVMDGLTATREIRKLSRPDAQTIPIIALSANAFEEDVKQCLDAGMNRHLSKPVDLEKLLDTLGEIVVPSTHDPVLPE